MRLKEKPPVDKSALTATLCACALTLAGIGLLVLYIFTGYHPLLLTAVITLLPALAQLTLLPKKGSQPQPPEVPEEAPKKKEKLRLAFRKCGYLLKKYWYRWRDTVVAVLIAVVTLAAHLVFWKWKDAFAENLNFLTPVLLAALFVLFIVLEKWCSHGMRGDSTPANARLKGLLSALSLGRIALLLSFAASTLKLLGIYDASTIACTLLSILFVYETAMLTFSLAVRLIRKELSSCPELLVGVHGMGKDMNILTYLEQNTGITMRSLWSLQLMKKLLAPALLGLVLALWLCTGLVQIESYQQGALFRLGKLHPKVLKPGFHMTLPWPFDRVEVYETQPVKKLSIGYIPEEVQDNIWTESHGGEEYRLLLGGGAEIVSVNLVVEYQITDLLQYIRSSTAPESLLQARAYEIITARTISTDLDTLLAADREVFSETFRKELTQSIDDYNIGLSVVNVVLESIHPPVEIAFIYQDMISAGIDAKYMRLYAESTANQLVMTAKEDATRAIGTAEAEQHKAIGAAKAAVTEFMASKAAYDTYQQQYRFQKYLNALSSSYGNATLIIAGEGIDTKNIYIGSLAEQETEPEATEPTYEYYEDELGEFYE